MDRAGRVRVITTSILDAFWEPSWTIFLTMADLRNPPLLTPNLRKLKWETNVHSFTRVINLFLGSALRSLEIDAKLLVKHVIRSPLGDVCPKLEHLKITGNGRSAANTISSVLCGLHCLEMVACSTLNDDAFLHLAQLKRLSYLAFDMRWSELCLARLRDRLLPGSFPSLQTLYWKDYDLRFLSEIFLMPNISLSNVHLEIERFCTSSPLRAFLRSFAEKFPHTREFSLVHDIWANRRFGLQVDGPGREHQLDACDLKPLFTLKSLRVLNLVDLGDLQLDDDLVEMIASALLDLEQLRLGTEAEVFTPTSVTFGALLLLLQRCPKLQSVGLFVNAEGMLSLEDRTVRHDHVTHLCLEGSILRSRRAEVDEMLKRVFPGLITVEESLDGVKRRLRDMGATEETDDAIGTSMGGNPITGRRTRNSLGSARSR